MGLPIILWICAACRLTIRGTIKILCNPLQSSGGPASQPVLLAFRGGRSSVSVPAVSTLARMPPGPLDLAPPSLPPLPLLAQRSEETC